MSFAEQLKAFQMKTDQKMVKIVERVINHTAETLIELSPHGDWEAWSDTSRKRRPRPPYEPGRFRGAWDYGRNVIPQRDLNVLDEHGEISRERIAEKIIGMSINKAAARHYLINRTPYAKEMEDATGLVGHNLQLGHMVEATAHYFNQIVKTAAENGRR